MRLRLCLEALGLWGIYIYIYIGLYGDYIGGLGFRRCESLVDEVGAHASRACQLLRPGRIL